MDNNKIDQIIIVSGRILLGLMTMGMAFMAIRACFLHASTGLVLALMLLVVLMVCLFRRSLKDDLDED